MFNYELIVKDAKGNVKGQYELEQGKSKGGIRTVAGKSSNKVIMFGKMYIDEPALDAKETKEKK